MIHLLIILGFKLFNYFIIRKENIRVLGPSSLLTRLVSIGVMVAILFVLLLSGAMIIEASLSSNSSTIKVAGRFIQSTELNERIPQEFELAQNKYKTYITPIGREILNVAPLPFWYLGAALVHPYKI